MYDGIIQKLSQRVEKNVLSPTSADVMKTQPDI